MCALPALLPLQESSLILSFYTCSQIPSLSQTRIVPQLMERGSWGKLWWAIINQPATEPSRYSKHRGSAGWRLRNPLLLVFSGSATVLHSWGATFDCRSSNVYSSCCDWLLCWHRDVPEGFYEIMDQNSPGFPSWQSSTGTARHRDPGWAAARLPAQLTFAVINWSRQLWQGLLVIQNRSHWRGETD